LFSLR